MVDWRGLMVIDGGIPTSVGISSSFIKNNLKLQNNLKARNLYIQYLLLIWKAYTFWMWEGKYTATASCHYCSCMTLLSQIGTTEPKALLEVFSYKPAYMASFYWSSAKPVTELFPSLYNWPKLQDSKWILTCVHTLSPQWRFYRIWREILLKIHAMT